MREQDQFITSELPETEDIADIVVNAVNAVMNDLEEGDPAKNVETAKAVLAQVKNQLPAMAAQAKPA